MNCQRYLFALLSVTGSSHRQESNYARPSPRLSPDRIIDAYANQCSTGLCCHPTLRFPNNVFPEQMINRITRSRPPLLRPHRPRSNRFLPCPGHQPLDALPGRLRRRTSPTTRPRNLQSESRTRQAQQPHISDRDEERRLPALPHDHSSTICRPRRSSVVLLPCPSYRSRKAK